MNCVKCGERLRDDASFCTNCGCALEEVKHGEAKKEKSRALIFGGAAAVAVVVALVAFVLLTNPSSPASSEPQFGTQDMVGSSQEPVADQDDGVEDADVLDDQILYVGMDYSDIDVPFWGVFGYASKERSGAEDMAAAMCARGYESGVLLTTDWENLNSEPWYVVCTGVWNSKEEAQEMVDTLSKDDYSDIYAKYTGKRVR